MSVRRRVAAGSGRPPLAWLLLAAAVAFLVAPTFALAFVSGDTSGCLCQSPQPLGDGDSLAAVAFLGVSHGWLACGTTLLTTACGLGVVSTGARTPLDCTWTATSVGRPPPRGA